MTLRTNLATRPFYNVRAVQAALAVFGIVVLAFTLFNVVSLVRLRGALGRVGAEAAANEAEAVKLRAEAARIRTQIDARELEAVAAAAREANDIIDRRAFSWTELMTMIEATLPADVRITVLQPRLDRDIFKVGMVAEAREHEDVSEFIESLEETGAFRNVVPLQQFTDEDGLIEVAIEGDYRPRPRDGASPAPAATGSARGGAAARE